jgi:glucoamylase
MDQRFALWRGHACVGLWEEASARHYYTGLVQLGALVRGEKWIGKAADKTRRNLTALLDEHWSTEHGVFLAAIPMDDNTADFESMLDASFLLGALDADLPGGPHSAADPRVHAQQKAVEALFARAFAINRAASRQRAPAIGRYKNDKYFGGGAWLPTTLAAATLYYRRAVLESANREELIKKGDGFLDTVRQLLPPDGSMPEQVDSTTGQPASARHLTWSYAAFVSAVLARQNVT